MMEKKIIMPEECNNLKELFESWQAAHIKEVDRLSDEISKRAVDSCDSEIFIKEYYKKRENTISSQFVQFFSKGDCKKCEKNRGILSQGDIPWEYVLKNAFNMDGCVGTFDVGEGFEYIFLLKEANDSKKTCIEDYPKFELREENVNMWVQDWLNPEKKEKAKMLEKINKALKEFIKEERETGYDFTQKVAYMNVNKRGGTFITTGYDESAVIHYAERYREYMLREIQLLAKARENVTVFVCGGKGYFKKLMNALEIMEHGSKRYEIQLSKTKVVFINVPHPSGRVSIETMVKKMNGVQ